MPQVGLEPTTSEFSQPLPLEFPECLDGKSFEAYRDGSRLQLPQLELLSDFKA